MRNRRTGYLPLSLALLAALACGGSAAPVSEVRTGRVLAADGQPIVYEDRGAGDTALVFVHCWACDRGYWREQLDAFAADYRVVALDLAGHGESGKSRESWTLEGLGDDVVAVVEHLGLERAILIGHSMGGPVALFAARRLPGRVLGIVAVDTLHNAEQEFPSAMVEMLAAGFEADFESAMRGAVNRMLGEGVEPEIGEWVAERACSADPQATVAILRAFAGFDAGAAMRAADVPIRAINAAPASPLQPPTEIELNRKYADYDAVIVEGVGHFLLLEAPERINPLLAEAIAEIEARQRSR